MPADLQKARELFLHAVGKLPPDQWEDYVAVAAGGDAELAQQVERLLKVHREAGSFLDQPVAAIGATGAISPGLGAETPAVLLQEQPGTIIGPYKLIQQIGEGGMGTVYMAQQTEPVKRVVALKLIKAGMDSKQIIARFEAERQALALMDHPNIARVLDAGTISYKPDALARDSAAPLANASGLLGRPYFVMELVKGVSITKYCDEHRLTPRQRLELFVPVCQAVQHAHQKGIIHRDLKPSNVLVAQYDGRPVPKVIDFGVAKAAGQSLTDKTLVTGFGNIVGTLEYMSPEQAEVNQLDIDTRSDIYSLGVLLYELLAGSPPFSRKDLEKAGILEMLRVIREQEPSKPSTKLSSSEALPTLSANRGTEPAKLTRLVRGELDWIVMKALEKDRNRRYETANGFAMDVQRYLADEPVQACPPSAGYRLRKLVRRNKTQAVFASIVLLFLVVLSGGVGYTISERSSRQARATAQVELILDEAEQLERGQKWLEARAAVGRAEAVLAGDDVGDPIRQRVSDARGDLVFVAELDRIRQARAASIDGKFNNAGAARDYARAFRDYGVDVETLPTQEAVAELRRKPALVVPFAAALDDWVAARDAFRKGEPTWQPLVAVARGLDPDPLRDRLRATLGQPVTPELQAELRRLAESIDVKIQSPATLLVLANTLDTAGLPDSALQVWRAGQSTYPADFWLSLGLGFALGQGKDDAEQTRYYTAAISIRPDSAVAHVNLGFALFNQGKADDAVAECRKAIELDSKSALAHNNLGIYLREQGKLDQAVVECRKAIELNPKDASGYISLGNALHSQGKLDDAIAAYLQAIELDPKDAGAHSNLGIALLDQGKLDDAIAEYRKAIDLDPNFAMAHSNLSTALRDQGKLDEAIAECRKAIGLNPKLARAHMNLGNALHDQRKLDEAIAEYRKAIELDPKDALAHYGLGNPLCDQGKLDEAIHAFRKAIELNPKLARAHHNLGIALHRQGKHDKAAFEYRKAIELDPKDAGTHGNLGNALSDQGRLDEAIAEYRKAIEVDPSLGLSHYNLGSALRDKGRPEEAVAEYRKCIELDPKIPQAHLNLAEILRVQGKLDEAVAEYRQVIALDPKLSTAHSGLGNVLADQGKRDEAIAEFRKAIVLDPKVALAHYNLAELLRVQGKLDEAVAEYRQVIALDPKNSPAHSGLSDALRQLNKLDEAIAECCKAIDLDPKNGGAHLNLGTALHDQGKPVEAIAEFRNAIALDPKYALAHYNLGTALFGQQKLDEAIVAFKQAIHLKPDHAEAHGNLGVAFNLNGKLPEAIAELKEAIRLKPEFPNALVTLAALLATSPDPKLRGPAEAVKLARQAIKLAPDDAAGWQALGWALYQTREWKASIDAFRKSIELQQEPKGGDAGQWFGLAVDQWMLGNKEEASKWYDKAAAWMDQNGPKNEELRRYRIEAEEQLGLKKKM